MYIAHKFNDRKSLLLEGEKMNKVIPETPLERIDDSLKYNPLMQFIGADNVKKIQDGFTDLLLEQIRDDLRDYGQYIFYPPDHENIIDDAFDKVSKKIQKMYEGAMLDVAQRSVEKWKELAMAEVGIEKPLKEKVNEDET